MVSPTSAIGVPVRTGEASMSMSSSIQFASLALEATLIDGAGFAPKTEPRPGVKTIRLAPAAIWPVAEHGS